MIVAGEERWSDQHQFMNIHLDTPFVITSGVTHLNTEDLMSSFHNYIDGVTFNYDGTKMYTITSYRSNAKLINLN